MAETLFHSSNFPRGRCRAQPYIPGLLFKARMENNARCFGRGHLNPATAIILTGTMATARGLTASPVTRAPISCAWERRKLELRGFFTNSLCIRISGCRR